MDARPDAPPVAPDPAAAPGGVLDREVPPAAPPADSSDPDLRAAQTVPVLAPEFMDRLRPLAREEGHPDGTLLFERGEREVHVHGVRQFTGELDLLNDREILVSGRTRGPIRVLRVSRPEFRTTIMAGPELEGFVRTGFDGEGRPLASPFATSRPGVLAVGDVRAGSVKRVAPGVGEGSVAAVHRFLRPGAG